MGFFERQFRSQFTPANGGYLFRHRQVDYWFDEEDVAQLAAEWRRHWANPLVWAAYLLLGVAVPLYAYFQGYTGVTFVLGLLATIIMAVNLIYPLRQPHELAAARRGFVEQRPQAPPSLIVLVVAIAALIGAAIAAVMQSDPEKPWYGSPFFFWFGWLGWTLCVSAWGHYFASKDSDGKPPLRTMRRLEQVGGAIAAAVFVAVQWLKYDSEAIDRGFSIFFAVVLIVGYVMGQRREAEERAASGSD